MTLSDQSDSTVEYYETIRMVADKMLAMETDIGDLVELNNLLTGE